MLAIAAFFSVDRGYNVATVTFTIRDSRVDEANQIT